MELTIQIVNFRSRHYLRECLFSIAENLPAAQDTEIILINNDEQPLDDIAAEMNGRVSLRAVELAENVGFGKAQNAGFRHATGEYILFLNPDTKIDSPSLFLMADVFSDEKVGIVGSLLLDAEGELQPDCFGDIRSLFSTVKGKLFGASKPQLDFSGDVLETGWVSGGAMMVRKDLFESLGGFDENYFMYFEDVDLCSRAKEAGYKVVVDPRAKIFHSSGKSFEDESEKKKYYYTSQDYYFQKHFGPVSAGLMKVLRLPYYIKHVYLR